MQNPSLIDRHRRHKTRTSFKTHLKVRTGLRTSFTKPSVISLNFMSAKFPKFRYNPELAKMCGLVIFMSSGSDPGSDVALSTTVQSAYSTLMHNQISLFNKIKYYIINSKTLLPSTFTR